MLYNCNFKSIYRIENLSVNLEIFNKNTTINTYLASKNLLEYSLLFNYSKYWNLTEDFHLYHANKEQIKKCIFCHKTSNEVSFEKRPHVIPYMLGNQFLLHAEECNECNEYFGKTLECELDKYIKPYRILNRIRNRKEKLITSNLKNSSFKFDEQDNYFSLNVLADDFILDESSNTVTLKIQQEKYIPILVYKALMKIIYGLLPRDHLLKFEMLRKWIMNRDTTFKLYSPLNVIKTRLDGLCTTPLNIMIYHKEVTNLEDFKKQAPVKENFEYVVYFRFSCIVFEIPVLTDLSFEKIKYMKKSNKQAEFLFPCIPKPGSPSNNEIIDFSETNKICNKEEMFFSYEKMKSF